MFTIKSAFGNMSKSSESRFENRLQRSNFFSNLCGPVELDSLSEAGTNLCDKIHRSSALGP